MPSLDWGALPPRIEGVIEERIDRLDPVLQAMLAAASVEGEQFTAEVVARVEGFSEREAIRHLSELDTEHGLVRAQGILVSGGLRLSPYRFEHNLFRQYLYSNLDEVERAYLHHDVGQVLEELYREQTAEIAGQLAHHFEKAGMPERAAALLLQAGNRAHRMSAHQEALASLNRTLALLAHLPEGTERGRLELQLQTLLATTLVVAQGYASPQVQQTYIRARELSRILGDPPSAIPILYGLSTYQSVRAQLAEAYEQGQHLLALAGEAGATGFVLSVQLVLGAAALHMGKWKLARKHLEQVIDDYDPNQHGEVAHALGHDPVVGAWSYLSLVLWHQGYPDQALAASDAALDRARELRHPYSQGYAASFAAMLQQMLRQWPACQARAEDALWIGREGGFPLWQAIGAFTRSWAMAQQGATGDGIVELVQGPSAWASVRRTEQRRAVAYDQLWRLMGQAALQFGQDCQNYDHAPGMRHEPAK